MSHQISEQSLSEQQLLSIYQHSLNHVLKSYPTLENEFDDSLKKEHRQQMDKNDELIQDMKLHFLDLSIDCCCLTGLQLQNIIF